MKKNSASQWFAFVFGFFLGLCIWKFGNPVILDHKIPPPENFSELLNESWPPHWAKYFLLPLALVGGGLVFQRQLSWPASRWLAALPLAWFGWQLFSSGKTVDETLTTATLWQFFGVIAAYFLGALLLAREHLWRWLLPGLCVALTFCLVRAMHQKVFEFPMEHQVLVEGERSGWTNFPPEIISSMKREMIIITTNGVDVANPVILKKMERGRTSGTLVYPNALAGLILLLWPLAFAAAWKFSRDLKSPIRFASLGLAIFLGAAALFWSGSKLGCLLAIFVAGIFLLRLDWSKKLKIISVAVVIVLGLGMFAVRFHNYFAAGATSAGARLDYWSAAVKVIRANPLAGTGPGTFQRPYERLKSPEAEMARLTHNDYLQQFSDSGIPGGIFYLAWIALALITAAKKILNDSDAIDFAMFAGVLAWFLQGFGEFSLYIPALAWTAFLFLGVLVARPRVRSGATL